MASQIPLEIPQQNFEKIRDRIGEIIADEFIQQRTFGDTLFDAKIFVERFIPPQLDEMKAAPLVNVVYSDATYNFHTPETRKGDHNYNIDVYSQAKSDATTRGDKKATVNLHKILGAIAAIFTNSVYLTLGFPRGFIESSNVVSIRIDEPDNNADTKNTIMGRVVLQVRFEETTQPGVPVPAEGFTTKVRLDETEKGFQYIQDN